MGRTTDALAALSRHDRDALRALLVRAVAVSGRPGAADELPALVAGAPIDALPAAAELHRVTGAVLRALDGVPGVPEDVRTTLEARRRATSMRHLLIAGALVEAGRAFDAAGLEWVVMKGPVVAGLLYPDASDRSYGDLDLLVARHDYPRAVAVLEDLGYASTIHNWALAEAMLAGQIGMTSPAVAIDLHWALHYSHQDRRPYAFVPEEMIARARTVDAAGLRCRTLDREDTLITLAFHAARSDGHRLLWLKDVERSLAVDRPDLDEVVRRAHAYRCAPPVGLILGRARHIIDADVSADVVQALVPAPLRGVDTLTTRVVDPVRFDERRTVTRWLTRSVRGSFADSVVDTPGRLGRRVHRMLRPPAVNETDDPAEKASYLAAVAGSRPGPASA